MGSRVILPVVRFPHRLVNQQAEYEKNRSGQRSENQHKRDRDTLHQKGLRMNAAICRPLPGPTDPSSVASQRTSPRFRTLEPTAERSISTHLSSGRTRTTVFPLAYSA